MLLIKIKQIIINIPFLIILNKIDIIIKKIFYKEIISYYYSS